jgi:hypothetical protein
VDSSIIKLNINHKLITPNKSKFAGRKIPITPTVDRLFPTVLLFGSDAIVEANFGDNKAKPFVYDLEKCLGLELACV